MIVGPDGQSTHTPPFIGDFEATESASCGGDSLKGVIDEATYLKHPDVYRFGAQWFVYSGETADPDAWGRLTQPVISGGLVELSARGPAQLAEREVRSRLYQDRGFSEWSPADADPHEYSMHKKIDVDLAPGRAKFKPQKDVNYNGGEQAGVIRWQPGEALTRIAFRIRKSEDDGGWELVLHGANTHENGEGAALTEITTWSLGAVNPDGTDIEYGISGNYDLLRLGLRKIGAQTQADPPRFWVTKMRVNGVADGDFYDAADVVRDLCALLGWSDAEVDDTGINILPFRIDGESLRDVFDYCALISGYRAVARRLPARIVMDFGPWTRNVYSVLDPHQPRNLQAQTPYNRMEIVFTVAGSETVQSLMVEAEPDPLTYPSRTPEPLEIPYPVPNKEFARDIGQRIIDAFANPTPTGDFQITEVTDSNGIRRPAHVVRGGDSLYYPEVGKAIKIADLSKSTTPIVSGQFVVGLPLAERVQARRQKRLERRRPALFS